MTAGRWRSALLGFVLGFVLAAAVPSSAAWLATAAPQRAAAKFGTWATCTAGSLTITSDLDGYTTASGGTSYNITQTDVADDATTQGDDRRRSFVHWSIPALPSGCVVTSAVVTLRQTGGTFNGGIVLQQVGATWNETTAKPVFGIAVTGPTFALSAFCTTPCSRTATVTSAVAGWVASPASNFGVRVTFANESSTTTSTHTLNFGTREHATASNRPSLVVQYG